MIIQCRFEGHLSGFDPDTLEASVDAITQYLTDLGLDNLAVSATLRTAAIEVEFTVAAASLQDGQSAAWGAFAAAIKAGAVEVHTAGQEAKELATA